MKIKIVVLCLLLLFIPGKQVLGIENIPYSATKTATDVYYNGEVISKIYKGSIVEIITIKDKWTTIKFDTNVAKIKTSDIYLKKEFIKFLENNPNKMYKTTEVKTNNVRVKEIQSDYSKTIYVIGKQSSVQFISNNDSWSKILVDDLQGYVRNSAIKVSYNIKVPKYENKRITRDEVVDMALKYVGNPYVWGGTSLVTGADCSGFVRTILSLNGIWVPRVSFDQSSYGRTVELNSLRKGDLVFYIRDGIIGHVGMYIGNGKIIQALNENVGVIISNVDFKQPIIAKDVIGG